MHYINTTSYTEVYIHLGRTCSPHARPSAPKKALLWRTTARKQSSGNPFPAAFQGVCSQDMHPFTICGQGPPLEEEGIISLSPQNERNEAIKITCSASSPGFYSRLFLVPKISGGWMPLTNLSLLNTFLEIPHFIDLIDAYFHIIIHQGY